jgi:hypothetical protein
MPQAAASSSKDAVKAEDKATKDPQESLGVLEEDDEFEEFAAAGMYTSIASFIPSLLSHPLLLTHSMLFRLG